MRSKIGVYISKCLDSTNNDYKSYGAKGIRVDKEWVNDTLEFVRWSNKNGYRKGAWLYRYDKTKDISPENCYWGEPNTFKLNCDMIENIKTINLTNKKIAEKYGVTGERIRQIKKGYQMVNCK